MQTTWFSGPRVGELNLSFSSAESAWGGEGGLNQHPAEKAGLVQLTFLSSSPNGESSKLSFTNNQTLLIVKFVLAPDKFKGSLTGIEFCDVVEEGIISVLPEAEILKVPLADGGDGTIEILDYHLHGKSIEVDVKDPLFRSIKASYLFIESLQTAFIEMAEASGMKLLSADEQNCF